MSSDIGTWAAPIPSMQLTHGLNLGSTLLESVFGKRRRQPATPSASTSSPAAVAEINSYIALRDMYLAEAEETTTEVNVNRVGIANDLVATYVKPAQSPYQAQYLPEIDAVRERQRCEAVKLRLAELARVAESAR